MRKIMQILLPSILLVLTNCTPTPKAKYDWDAYYRNEESRRFERLQEFIKQTKKETEELKQQIAVYDANHPKSPQYLELEQQIQKERLDYWESQDIKRRLEELEMKQKLLEKELLWQQLLEK